MTGVSAVYGEALYTLAQEECLSAEILPQLEMLEKCFADQPGYLDLLSCQSLPKQERCALLDESIKDAVHPYLLNFLKILVEKGYIRHFSHCCEAYRQSYYRDNGILPVTAVTALPLSAEQIHRLTDKLAAITKKTILLSNEIDKDLLGGMQLDYDGKQLEDSIAHRLDTIRQKLKNTVL